MNPFTKDELKEALRAIFSMIHKCEKVQEKPSLGNSQRTLLNNRIKALRISAALISKAMEEQIPSDLPMV